MDGNFKFVELDQKSHEWIVWRHNGIGASDAPVIMRENPWKTINELRKQKLGPAIDQYVGEAAERGTRLEPVARSKYNRIYGYDVSPVCVESNVYPWLKASIDGYSLKNGKVVEIKCGDSVYRKTSISRRPPDYYYGQLQHILAILGLPSIDFFCYLPDKPDILVNVKRDKPYIERLIREEEKFWNNLT